MPVSRKQKLQAVAQSDSKCSPIPQETDGQTDTSTGTGRVSERSLWMALLASWGPGLASVRV